MQKIDERYYQDLCHRHREIVTNHPDHSYNDHGHHDHGHKGHRLLVIDITVALISVSFRLAWCILVWYSHLEHENNFV